MIMLETTDKVNLAYSVLIGTGGLIGFLKAGSIPSLVAGFGSAMIVAGVTCFEIPPRPYVVTAVAATLGLVMGKKFLKTNKFMPPGLIATASILILANQVYQMWQTKTE